jgi:hypothetical protein
MPAAWLIVPSIDLPWPRPAQAQSSERSRLKGRPTALTIGKGRPEVWIPEVSRTYQGTFI